MFDISDDERMLSQAITFFTAGYETTSNLIAFTLYELCIHPKVQNRLRKEIQEIVEKHGDITYEAIQEMKYLDMVVSGKNLGKSFLSTYKYFLFSRNTKEVSLWSFSKSPLR